MQFKNLFTGIVILFMFVEVSAQQYGPKPVKNFDYKNLKGKTLLIPDYDKVADYIKPGAFNAYEIDKKVDAEYQKRWETGINSSTWDFTPFKVERIMMDRLKKEKDATVIALFFEKDFYQNSYASIAVFEPKYMVIATTPINGMDLSDTNDIRLMMNLLTYSIVGSGKMNAEDFRPIFKGHKFKYALNVVELNKDISNKVFLVPSYGKEVKNFQKLNEKISNYLRENWKLSRYEFVNKEDLANRVSSENFHGYYLSSIPIYTTNPLMPFNFWIVVSSDNTIVCTQMGENVLTSVSLKLIETNLTKWLSTFTMKLNKTTPGKKQEIKPKEEEKINQEENKTEDKKETKPGTTKPKTTKPGTTKPKTQE